MSTALLEAAKLLGVPSKNTPLRSSVEYLAHLKKGLPIRTLDTIVDVIAPGNAAFKYLIVSRATWNRKRGTGRLSKLQGEVVTRLAEVWSDAIRVWKSEEEAREFLSRPHPLLENKKPLDLALESEIGAQLVRDVLARLEHGAVV
jgi:putative toxin-antitoxin system antitoxin component (TIGR02293 family)